MWFSSDNAAGVAPEVLLAMTNAAPGWAMAYGNDEGTSRAADMIRDRFEAPEAAVYFVATGTAANSLALACLAEPWNAIYCHQSAHIEEDECNGPEFFSGGAKLALIPGEHGRMMPEGLQARLDRTAQGDVHGAQRGPLSITNATEAGTLYDPSAVDALSAVAMKADVSVHMDGTRFAYAVAALGCTPAELSWKAGVDILCLGATKNGAIAAEAVILFDPKLAWEFELRRKRAGHLFSKMRFLAAQFEAMMTDDLWLELAGRANATAGRLADGLSKLSHANLIHPVEANLMFVELPRRIHKSARAKGAAYALIGDLDGPDDEMLTCRLVCSAQTTGEEVDAFLKVIT